MCADEDERKFVTEYKKQNDIYIRLGILVILFVCIHCSVCINYSPYLFVGNGNCFIAFMADFIVYQFEY